MHNIVAEVAKTPRDTRNWADAFRNKQMAAHEGMIFVFEEPGDSVFLDAQTPTLPLSTAFVADDGTVVKNIEDMNPQTEISHCSAKPVRFVS
ncbi:MAG: DUF192 domain-containing protein [Ideonella sp.]|nr:DUF192 domain-containing protein [Ideonella sp.]